MLEEKGIDIAVTADARKQPLDAAAAWELLTAAEAVLVGRGNKVMHLEPGCDSKDTILAQCLGRSGTLRAPTLRIGKRLLVGFNATMYEDLTPSGDK